MEINIDNITNADEDVMLPEGWGENDDIFADPETWTGAAGADESGAAQAGDNGGAGLETDPEPAPTTEQAAAPTTGQQETGGVETPAEDNSAPTTGQEPKAGEHKKLKFTAKIDREDREVELDESELPGVYQRAQNHDRAQSKLAQLSPLMESAEAMAKRMGYENLEDMIGKAEGTFLDAEVKRLTDDGVHEEVARDMVRRRMDAAAQTQQKEPAQEPTRPSGRRDYQAETRELLTARPELQGKKLPDEVVNDCIQKGKNLLVAYAEYETRQERAQAESLRAKLQILEQNAASAAKGPVKGAAGGGPTDTKAEDLFLKGFEDDNW